MSYKQLENFSNYYIYEDGRIYSIKAKRFLKPINSIDKNLNITLRDNNKKRKFFYVNRLIYEAFNGPIPEGLQVIHINGIRDDNRLINLRLLTHKEVELKKKEYIKKYKEEHKEEIKLKSKIYYEENKEEILRKNKEHYENNKEEINKKRQEYNKNYYENNREEINKKKVEYNKNYRENNRDKYNLYQRQYYYKMQEYWKNKLNQN